MDTAAKPLVEFIAGGQPLIEVFAAEKRSTPVSRRLYGQFAEHLFDNVYFGMWAQLLRNPGFEPAHYFGNKGEDDLNARLRWREKVYGVPDQLDSFRAGVAYYWSRFGKGDVTYSPSDDRINSDLSQKIEIASLESPEVGIQQPIYLPTHRTDKYEASIWVNGACKSLHLAVRTTDGKKIGSAVIANVTAEWNQHKVSFTIDRNGIETGQALLFTVTANEPGTVYLDQCVLFPADNVKGFDPDIIRMLKDAKLPLLRFPGGNFVSGYRWQEGIGPIDERPMRNNCAWNHEEYNHVGTDEWLTFCELVGCEPMICVNAGDGAPEEAAEWVEYCNGDVTTEYGALRAKNGHPEPYGIKIWEVGNELWGDWQIGHCTPEQYADRYKAFHDAMLARDPSIVLIANGQDPKFNAPVIARHPGIIRSLSVHYLIGHEVPADTCPETVYNALVAFPVFAEQDILAMTKAMADGGVADPKIAITELMLFTQKRELPDCHSLAEVPFYAGILNMAIRLDGMVELITRSALVNHGAGLRKHRECVFANPVFYANKLYATQSGRWPVRISLTSPWYDSENLPSLSEVKDVPALDAVALLDDAGEELNLLVTNRSAKDSLTAQIVLTGFSARPEVKVQSISGDTFMSHNTFENPEEITIKESLVKTEADGTAFTFPPSSLTCLTFRRQ